MRGSVKKGLNSPAIYTIDILEVWTVIGLILRNPFLSDAGLDCCAEGLDLVTAQIPGVSILTTRTEYNITRKAQIMNINITYQVSLYLCPMNVMWTLDLTLIYIVMIKRDCNIQI